MNRIAQSFLTGIMAAACIFSLTATAYAESFGYTDMDDDYRNNRYHNPAPRHVDSYRNYQRYERESDHVRREQENLSRDYHRDVREFQQSRGYMRKNRR